MSRRFTISQGAHYANGLHLSLLVGNTYLSFQARFDADCLYKPRRNPEQINKLYGMAYGLHHHCSARFGWRSDGERIELLSYLYTAPGQRTSESVAFIDPGEWHRFTIHRAAKTVSLVMDQLAPKMYKLARPFPIGYRLFPYFGGTDPAPHEMHIEIRLMGMNGFGF